MTVETPSVMHRLAWLEAHEAIRQCVYRYALAGDMQNDSVGFSAIFCEHATFEAVGLARLEGRQAILKGLSAISAETIVWAFHVPAGPLIDLAADMKSAKVFWWLWALINLRGSDGINMPHWGAGHYNAELIDQDGDWKFSRVLLETKFQTPYQGAWTQVDGDFHWPS